MKKRSTLLLYFLLVFAPLIAQDLSISGKVIDASAKPIEFANVYLQHREDKSIQIGTITDPDGQFQLAIPQKGSYELAISFVGFSDWHKTLDIEARLDIGSIQLEAMTNDLEEIVVTADRNIITQKEDKLIFNVAASPLKSGYDGLEVLQRSPNVLVDSEGNISMRNEAPTVMINGRISNLSGAELANYISNLNSEEIKNIEIQTHLSANTDAQSSGGVINIILKKKPIGFDGSIRSDYTIKGSGFNGFYNGMNFNYGAQKWNIYGNYNYSSNSGETKLQNTFDYFTTEELIETDELFINDSNRHNYRIGFVGDIAKNQVIGIEGFGSNNLYNFENIGQVNSYQRGNLIEDGIALTTGQTDAQLNNLTFNYTWTIDTSNTNLKIFADFADQKVIRINNSASTYNQGVYEDKTERNIAPANTTIYSIQGDLEKHFKSRLKLEIGIKLTNTNRENTLLSDILINQNWTATNRTTSFNYSEQVLAGYVALNKKIGKYYFAKIGLRVENTNLERLDLEDNSTIQQNYTNWFPVFFLSRDLPQNRSISLSYSKRLRRPPFQFLNNNAIKINDFRYELGNPDLIPENVHNWELSFKEKKQRIDFYVQRTTEAINGIYFLEGQIAYYQKYNEGIQQQVGITYNRFGNLTSWWYIKGLVRIYNRQFINEAGEDSFKQTTVRMDFSNNFKINETTSIDLIGRYISQQKDAYFIVDGRYAVHLMLQKTFFNKQLHCRIYVNDLFNTLNFRSERPFDNFKATRYQKWRSRILKLRMTYNFNGKNKVNQRKNKSDNEAQRRL